MCVVLHMKYRVFVSGFNVTWIYFDRFLKSTEISDFMKIGVVGAELFHADGQTHRGTDGRTDEHGEVTSPFFLQFCERT